MKKTVANRLCSMQNSNLNYVDKALRCISSHRNMTYIFARAHVTEVSSRPKILKVRITELFS